MEQVNPIFSLPPLVVEKVKLSEIIELLHDRVNKGYMPSANGSVHYNSKPEYTRFAHPEHPDMPNVHPLVDYTGYFCLSDGFSGKRPIYFNLNIAQFQIMINLETEKALIRRNDTELKHTEPFTVWTDSAEETIPIMRDELKELLDNYA